MPLRHVRLTNLVAPRGEEDGGLEVRELLHLVHIAEAQPLPQLQHRTARGGGGQSARLKALASQHGGAFS
jgi:hypothetical protein